MWMKQLLVNVYVSSTNEASEDAIVLERKCFGSWKDVLPISLMGYLVELPGAWMTLIAYWSAVNGFLKMVNYAGRLHTSTAVFDWCFACVDNLYGVLYCIAVCLYRLLNPSCSDFFEPRTKFDVLCGQWPVNDDEIPVIRQHLVEQVRQRQSGWTCLHCAKTYTCELIHV